MEIVGRVMATLFIWIGMAGMLSTVGRQMSGGNLMVVVPIAIIAAAVATRFVWQGLQANMRPEPTYAIAEKSKRSSRNRLNQLVDTMSEDEAAEMLSEMRARILSQGSSDGELPLEALLGERERRGGTQRTLR